MAALLHVRGLSLQRDGRQLTEALSLDVSRGECVALRGRNGAGKTTLLRSVAGLYTDFEGEFDAAPCLYVGHRGGLSALLSAEENLHWYVDIAGEQSPDVEVRTALERVGLRGLARRRAGSLSQGQQRRLALARLLVINRPLWLLDEPQAALDDEGAELVSTLLSEHVNDGGGALVATHQSLTAAAREAWLSR